MVGMGGWRGSGFAFIRSGGSLNKRVIGQGRNSAERAQDLGTDTIPADSTMSLFTPADPHNSSRLFRFLREVNEKHRLKLESYQDLYQWSTSSIDLFWSHVWDHTQIIGTKGNHTVDTTATPAKNPAWFSDSSVNFAENLLSNRSLDTTAIVQVCTFSHSDCGSKLLAINFSPSGTNFPEPQASARPTIQRTSLLARRGRRVRPPPLWARPW